MLRDRLLFRHKLLYAMGNAGAVLGDTLIATFLLFLYFPPEGRGADLVPPLVFAVVPTWLLINLVARVIDGIADPLVALWSDRSRHPLGRRRIFMLWGAAPLALTTGLLFYPPFAAGSLGNTLFLQGVFCSYFFLFTIYVAPYLALLPELGVDPDDRLDLSTLLAFTALLGAGVAMVAGPALFLPKSGETSADLQRMAAALAVLSGVFLLLPALFLPERRRPEAADAPSLSFAESLRATLGNRRFRLYLLGTILFWFGFNIVRGATPYFVTVLMHEPLSFQAVAFGIVFAVAGACFPLTNWLGKRLGKARTMQIGAGVLALGLLAVPLIAGKWSGIGVLAVCGAGVGALLSVPNAMLADLCEAHARHTGQACEAMFFGAQGFFLKLNLGISSGVLGLSFALFGNGADSPLGVQLSGPLGAITLVGSIWAFGRFHRTS